MDLRTANVTRYILPLREGGSLPALAEADDEFKYVVKFRGAGHGTKALIAELIGGGNCPYVGVQSTGDCFSEPGRGFRTDGSGRRNTGFASMEPRVESGAAFSVGSINIRPRCA